MLQTCWDPKKLKEKKGEWDGIIIICIEIVLFLWDVMGKSIGLFAYIYIQSQMHEDMKQIYIIVNGW